MTNVLIKYYSSLKKDRFMDYKYPNMNKNKPRYNPRLPLPKKTERVHEDKTKYDRSREKNITFELDRVADELEPQEPRLALAIDLISDQLEQSFLIQ